MTTFSNEQLIAHLRDKLTRIQPARVKGKAAIEATMNQTALEIALAVLTAEPFMYAVADSTGCAVFGEHCVNKNPGELEDELQEPNDGFYDDTYGCRVVPVYHLPLVEALK